MADGQSITADEMKRRTKRFALRVLKLCRALPNTVEAQAVRRQLVRCGTSVGANDRAVGANDRAAQRARSHPEFKAKLGIVEEACDEACFWMELIIEDRMFARSRVRPLYDEAVEIVKIVARALRTAKEKKPLV